MTLRPTPAGWRSLLFVGADRPDRIAKAAECGADAVILDLEDAVPAAAKSMARAGLPDAIVRVAAARMPVVVRINAAWRDAVADLAAAVRTEVAAIMVPGCADPARLQTLAEMIGEWEAERGLPIGAIGVVALVESAAGLENLTAIARAPRVIGLALGTEDLALDLAVAPSAAMLDLPSRRIALAARAVGAMALAVPISIAAYADDDAYRSACAAGRAHGVTGAICIHPRQVAAANAVFRPGTQELAEARAVITAWAERGDSGVIALDGRMIDLPVVERARRLVATAEAQDHPAPS